MPISVSRENLLRERTPASSILRDEWGFKYVVVSDCGAIGDFFNPGLHETHPDAATASASAVTSGTDLECGWGDYMQLEAAVDRD